jgi:hypothetical protein
VSLVFVLSVLDLAVISWTGRLFAEITLPFFTPSLPTPTVSLLRRPPPAQLGPITRAASSQRAVLALEISSTTPWRGRAQSKPRNCLTLN